MSFKLQIEIDGHYQSFKRFICKNVCFVDSNLSQQTSLVNALMNRSDKDRDGMYLYNQLILFYSSHRHYRNGAIFHFWNLCLVESIHDFLFY